MTEALVLKSLLDAYGAPGIKLAQYLAFTHEFAEFQNVLEVYQDSAMPISYFEAVRLITQRLGSSWDPLKYRVKSIIGSGSVNIAIELVEIATGESLVVTVLRDNIEVKTKEDFRRFELLISSLIRNPTNSLSLDGSHDSVRDRSNKKRFEFVTGLMGIIKKSVELEFDKKNAFEIQRQATKLYHRNIGGWQVQTVEARGLTKGGLFMEKAPGEVARKVLHSQPEVYNSAMAALVEVEFGILRGVSDSGNFIPLPLIANPDLHDGQVLLDVSNRIVTILDFGQALGISNLERDFAIDLLRIVVGGETPKRAKELLEKWSVEFKSKQVFSELQIKEILAHGERMDIFVHLISMMETQGMSLPLSSIHWILAANRLMILSQRIHHPVDLEMKLYLGSRKVGVPQSVFNWFKTSHALKPQIQPHTSPLCREVFGK